MSGVVIWQDGISTTALSAWLILALCIVVAGWLWLRVRMELGK